MSHALTGPTPLEAPITDITAEHDVYFGTPEEGAEAEDLQTASLAVVERVEHRPNVSKIKGRLTLMDTGLTPHQAMVEDLLFVRRVLDDAGIDYLLVRGNDQRPVIAIDLKLREELRRAFVEACSDEPFYSRSVDTEKSRTLLVADGELSPHERTRIIRLFRPRGPAEPTSCSAPPQASRWSCGNSERRRSPSPSRTP